MLIRFPVVAPRSLPLLKHARLVLRLSFLGSSICQGIEHNFEKGACKMRKILLTLAVFGLAGSLWAADPIAGTWKLNLAKSKSAPGQQAAVKEMTVTSKEVGADIETTFAGIGSDGKPFSMKFTNPKQGGLVKTGQPATEGNMVVITVVKPGDMYGTSIQKGVQVEVTHVVVSKDGKTMTRTAQRVDEKGAATESLMFFEKQ